MILILFLTDLHQPNSPVENMATISTISLRLPLINGSESYTNIVYILEMRRSKMQPEDSVILPDLVPFKLIVSSLSFDEVNAIFYCLMHITIPHQLFLLYASSDNLIRVSVVLERLV